MGKSKNGIRRSIRKIDVAIWMAENREKRAHECWPWPFGKANKAGYCRTALTGRKMAAHRVMYEMYAGSIPKGLTLDHLCRVRSCVNPSHLEPVSLRENTYRGSAVTTLNAMKMFCAQGHRYTTENTGFYWHKGTKHRRCRICVNARNRSIDRSDYFRDYYQNMKGAQKP